ncbi:MAG: hypothetical protein A2Y78_08460 [Acidobacteria bacterium RBG_13_68_16]|nr:MAG: hypothetical protein A2Y78_08460 [Acidobacteria bacterium RBG_13_68_16]
MTPEAQGYNSGLDAALRCVAAQISFGWDDSVTRADPNPTGLEAAALEIVHLYGTSPTPLAVDVQALLARSLTETAQARAIAWAHLAGEYAMSEPGHDALAACAHYLANL